MAHTNLPVDFLRHYGPIAVTDNQHDERIADAVARDGVEPIIVPPARPETRTPTCDPNAAARPGFGVPVDLRYEDGPFEHQGRAVSAWCNAGYRGVLEMATGSGKTITAMIAAHRLYQTRKPLLIVVTAPHVPLIQQWHEEMAAFGLEPINLAGAGTPEERLRVLQRLQRRLRTGLSDVEAIVLSHDMLCTPQFLDAVEGLACSRLLIADEAHNLGRPSFIGAPPECVEHRLGLSATPTRQYDSEGTDALFAFFGPVVFRFGLEEAIGRCLVGYHYHVHPVSLTAGELDEWFENGLAVAGLPRVVEMLKTGDAEPIWNLSDAIDEMLQKPVSGEQAGEWRESARK
ncbi:MAG: DEAD/DEAH box helicase family protein [Candidatus Schekmanbacteria bacterium]|nr:DEAD/DEAH box helicase family protein [Candidatus Schekmanbacteria bacterium]